MYKKQTHHPPPPGRAVVNVPPGLGRLRDGDVKVRVFHSRRQFSWRWSFSMVSLANLIFVPPETTRSAAKGTINKPVR